MGPLSRSTLIVMLFGFVAFVLGIVAENKKPGDDEITMVHMNNFTVCHYPKDPTVWLGAWSIVFLFVSTCLALGFLFYPHQGKRLPQGALWNSNLFTSFFVVSLAVYFASEALFLWATITEGMHRKRNKHFGVIGDCPTAKTGLFGGAAFLALDTSLMWLVCFILLSNVRADHFDEDFEEEEKKGNYAEIAHDYQTGNHAKV